MGESERERERGGGRQSGGDGSFPESLSTLKVQLNMAHTRQSRPELRIRQSRPGLHTRQSKSVLHMRQSRPEFGLGFQVRVRRPFLNCFLRPEADFRVGISPDLESFPESLSTLKV